MKHLIQVRNNIYYTKEIDENKKEEYKRVNEIVMLFDVAKYSVVNEGSILRERDVTEVRFILSEDGLDGLIKSLEIYRDGTEEDLH